MTRRHDAERGGIALTTVVASLILAVVAVLLVGAAVAVGEAAARARTAADAAALAGAATSPLVGGSGDPCAEAARLAAENASTLRDCSAEANTAGEPGVLIEVAVTTPVRTPLGGLAPGVEARAAAGVRPRPQPLGVVRR